MDINNYLIVMRDYDNFIINIKQDINRPNNPDDYELIEEYMRDNFLGVNHEIINLSHIGTFEMENL